MLKLEKYHGAGNDFLLVDNRDGSFEPTPEEVARLCNRRTGIGSDGLMLLDKGDTTPWKMRFYNPDGSGGMMCGNGGRCIVAFADSLGLPIDTFEAPDGIHHASIVGRGDDGEVIVRLAMIDVDKVEDHMPLGHFVDTGTRHLVTFVPSMDDVDVERDGARLRHAPEFAPQGVNVNFVQALDGGELLIRTFEKGVEAETLACGTGITAAALAAWHCGVGQPGTRPDGTRYYTLQARISTLTVDFLPGNDGTFTQVHLTGPAQPVATILVK